MKWPLRVVAALLVLMVAVVAAAIAFGGPGEAPPMASISNPFRDVDFSDLPAPRTVTARDGTSLAYRVYAPAGAPKGSVVLVHGSSGRGSSMHVMGKAFAASGRVAYALDLRGHGDSGVHGRIGHIGQLEEDLEDFMRSLAPAQPSTLAGFSAGGGFALRVAGSPRQSLFANYLLLSPFIGEDAPTDRPDSGGWVRVGVPRILGLAALNVIGIHGLNDLPVTNFALAPAARATLTPQYSFALSLNLRPQRDWRANIRAVERPMCVVAGQDDEVFFTDRFGAVFAVESKDVPVTLVRGVGHIALTLDARAMQAAVAAVDEMSSAAIATAAARP
jgi:non-heme chloroperoxidase